MESPIYDSFIKNEDAIMLRKSINEYNHAEKKSKRVGKFVKLTIFGILSLGLSEGINILKEKKSEYSHMTSHERKF
ncbi:hypothetical protein GW819_02445 [Candidatus Gracilibacteria bacterium]|nr:hypothetical protein [Candidatus Gracilibacteria bacterium]OIO78088.1 MAG: hypothetical protein AUJ87_00410 [Candidatus Gracilibacteria bacterium CG1_02_38_174]PIQ10697.1 MAG: hypothetical protein COW68_04065 [Candidatus Gracilibacteria bacterium CG18_big_fil_WC_8_21_14_2_50_38_16]PIQ42171.1 MAG: hypothetical protein COW06_00580 [Candidatus Gracilibacteria bacterium CG12_big_fil_rev_8_21_14_0_65_38_15]PIZ01802.1 MAG: hypothetical protein COY60_01650 [Candidatus Gracilibacteria bacterium CG_4